MDSRHREEREPARDVALDRLRDQVATGLEQARRGELLDGDEVFAEIERDDRRQIRG